MPNPVTISRIAHIMSNLGITLEMSQSHLGYAVANIEGINFSFGVLHNSMFIRGDKPLNPELEKFSPQAYLTANTLNSHLATVRVSIVEHEDISLIRIDKEAVIAAGLSDEQLLGLLSYSVTAIVQGFQYWNDLLPQFQQATS
ncbi:Uncharacterised protein [Corynebacterium kutscheri]|uniref:Bacterial sensory transduction regulator n=1 Tax=Corynebacterium kutscheri TaxID=35755 RepID=A0A0F6QZQ9_9CORY|nr:hypothetical protein [Corynebacterium kutscheri]AKE41312.1 hypothetical protein UL82_05685 [Corynebacterium kutscheri]VEH08588.1 Uncharacterised protein [Corynebacterium kutscheri]VEH09634.1 Uncharacterised protein [Corynebacterium kutscheri]VEH79717.1 Uncharacterised protein [Corynebacterium kutscheri]